MVGTPGSECNFTDCVIVRTNWGYKNIQLFIDLKYFAKTFVIFLLRRISDIPQIHPVLNLVVYSSH